MFVSYFEKSEKVIYFNKRIVYQQKAATSSRSHN